MLEATGNPNYIRYLPWDSGFNGCPPFTRNLENRLWIAYEIRIDIIGLYITLHHLLILRTNYFLNILPWIIIRCTVGAHCMVVEQARLDWVPGWSFRTGYCFARKGLKPVRESVKLGTKRGFLKRWYKGMLSFNLTTSCLLGSALGSAKHAVGALPKVRQTRGARFTNTLPWHLRNTNGISTW